MSQLGGMGARDIRMLLRGKVDPELGKVLVSLADRQDHLFQLLTQTAEAMNVLADSVLAQSNVLGTLKSTHEELKAARRAGVKVISEASRGDASDVE